ncbi:MAG: DEAD/DEAH box helicase [Planctomycetaceae bacterium]|jgi:superfamily II DNA/RNA helicase|nr:DEAD/DEAH box helicase [Planctomycetaceae bacterium]
MTDDASPINRDDLAFEYIEQLEFTPYPFQEEAIFAWFSSKQGVLVCAPTGMGKTLIAEAGLFESLKTGKRAYYTTPLIALTEQKYREIQAAAERWGFSRRDVGLVTGNRRENPDAKILVVVAEILFNRLLYQVSGNREHFPAEISSTAFDFDDVAVVVMDEFHSFADAERGIVWEFSLGLLPEHVRTLLISATVGNAYEFVSWLRNTTNRTLTMVQSDERKVPLTYCWVGDELLTEQLEKMCGQDLTPALVFCFNREECWSVADQIRGKAIISSETQKIIGEKLNEYDWSQGAGPKLRQLLIRGVGIHHAGILPRYRRIIESLFQQKLLSIAVCTETLAAGINLPARSVVLPSIIKGPQGEKKVVESSAAHQIFGRAGRPQFDTHGYVFALAHEDDVKIARFKEKYDQIPEDTKDPKLREMKKKLKKKMPTRRANEQYWSEQQFQQLTKAPPGRLSSRGQFPWRLLAHILEASPDVSRLRELVSRRLMGQKWLLAGQKQLSQMLLALWRHGYVRLEPIPTEFGYHASRAAELEILREQKRKADEERKSRPFGFGLFDDDFLADNFADFNNRNENKPQRTPPKETSGNNLNIGGGEETTESLRESYQPEMAYATEKLADLLRFRGVNPIYGLFLIEHLGIANREERMQAFESILEMPNSVAPYVRVPKPDDLPPGPLARERLDPLLLQYGLATVEEISPEANQAYREEQRGKLGGYDDAPVFVLTLAEKLRRLFDYEDPDVFLRTNPVWSAGEILIFKGDFNKYITSRSLQKQEGVIFRHLLRLILLLEEFIPFSPPGTIALEWQNDLKDVASQLTECCRKVDPDCTDEILQASRAVNDEAV